MDREFEDLRIMVYPACFVNHRMSDDGVRPPVTAPRIAA